MTNNVKEPAADALPGSAELLRNFNLEEALRQARSEPGMQSAGGRVTHMLTRGPGLRIGLIAMKSGSQWQEHKTESRIIVQVIEGHIRFSLKERAWELRKGELLVLEPGIPHSVEALAETAFLLTLC